MSSSIDIPKRRRRIRDMSAEHGEASSAGSSSSSSYSASLPSRPSAQQSSPASRKSPVRYFPERRPSLLSESISRSEYTVVNVGPADAPRLITCVRKSQGFEWNHDIFLPSYADRDHLDLEHRQDPIMDIILTDEEAAALLPQ